MGVVLAVVSTCVLVGNLGAVSRVVLDGPRVWCLHVVWWVICLHVVWRVVLEWSGLWFLQVVWWVFWGWPGGWSRGWSGGDLECGFRTLVGIWGWSGGWNRRGLDVLSASGLMVYLLIVWGAVWGVIWGWFLLAARCVVWGWPGRWSGEWSGA